MIKDIIMHIYLEETLHVQLPGTRAVTHRNTRIRENTRISFRCYSDP